MRHLLFHLSLTIPSVPKTMDSMTPEELYAKLQHSYEQAINGEVRPVDDVFDELEQL